MTSTTTEEICHPDPETIAALAAAIHRENLQDDSSDSRIVPRIDRRGGPKVLLLAIVLQAVSTVEDWSHRFRSCNPAARGSREYRRNVRTAYRYLISNSTDSVNCFLSVCELTGANPDAIRTRAFRDLTPEALTALFGIPFRKGNGNDHS
ncbi:MAG: hypothetical protein AB7O26_02780 [Planctomycetaceae bacterium]